MREWLIARKVAFFSLEAITIWHGRVLVWKSDMARGCVSEVEAQVALRRGLDKKKDFN
jgi:hypothetical protein